MHRPPFVGFDCANNIQLFASLRMTHRGIVLQTLMKEDELLEKNSAQTPSVSFCRQAVDE